MGKLGFFIDLPVARQAESEPGTFKGAMLLGKKCHQPLGPGPTTIKRPPFQPRDLQSRQRMFFNKYGEEER